MLWLSRLFQASRLARLLLQPEVEPPLPPGWGATLQLLASLQYVGFRRGWLPHVHPNDRPMMECLAEVALICDQLIHVQWRSPYAFLLLPLTFVHLLWFGLLFKELSGLLVCLVAANAHAYAQLLKTRGHRKASLALALLEVACLQLLWSVPLVKFPD